MGAIVNIKWNDYYEVYVKFTEKCVSLKKDKFPAKIFS